MSPVVVDGGSDGEASPSRPSGSATFAVLRETCCNGNGQRWTLSEVDGCSKRWGMARWRVKEGLRKSIATELVCTIYSVHQPRFRCFPRLVDQTLTIGFVDLHPTA